MNSLHCCQRESRIGSDADQQASGPRRVKGVAGLILPSILLVLMPKCPVCLAAYVALCTGVTMSFSSAHILLRTLIALCIGTLALCVVRRVLSWRHNTQTFHLQPTKTLR